MKIGNIESDEGNNIILALKSDGWKVISQYNIMAFDYDSYTLKKKK